MPVAGLKEGRKECDPNEECWSSNFVNGCGHSFSFSFLMRRCCTRSTRPPPHTHTLTLVENYASVCVSPTLSCIIEV
jgi:hypothetical protein